MPKVLTPAGRIAPFTLPDGYRAMVRLWENPEPAARMVWLHGIISHSGWYFESCRRLAQAGFEVHFLDRRGSGLNPAGRGDVDRWQTWLTDVESYLEHLPADRPRLLLGISWGGLLASAVARHRGELIDGLGLVCPGLFSQKDSGRWQRVLLRLAGMLGMRQRRVTIPLQQPELFTGSSRWQAYIGGDPLTLRKVTIRFALANLRLTRYAREAPEQVSVPTLLLLAGRDRITDNRRVLEFVRRIDCDERKVIRYAEAAHTLEFEPDPTDYFGDLIDWGRQRARSLRVSFG